MEAPLHHQYHVPPQPLPPAQDASSLLQQAVAARALMMAGAGAAGNKQQAPSSSPSGPGREQCPRCASRDTKFCYYNNYNTAQPRHFCRSCRRYWTLGGSLRNVPVGGSTRKRPRHARGSTRASMAAAVNAVTATRTTATTAASVGGSLFAAPATMHGGLLLSSLLLAGSVSASASASPSPLLALGSAPLLEGRLGFDLDLGLGDAGAAVADMAHHHQLPLGAAGPLPWPAATTATILEGDRAETTMTTWKDASSSVFPFPPAAALWQELAVAAPALHHGSAPHLLL